MSLPSSLPGSLATLRLELISALESSPASKQLSRAAEGLGDLNSWRAQLKRFNLTPAEELTVLNQCPRRPVEVHLLIENSEERLSEQDVDDLVKVVKDMLGEEDEEQEEEDEEGGGDGEEEEEGQQEQEEQGESQ